MNSPGVWHERGISKSPIARQKRRLLHRQEKGAPHVYNYHKIKYCSGGPDLKKSRTDADSDIAPSLGMGTVYVILASSPLTSVPSTKSRMSALRSGIVPSSGIPGSPQRTVLSPRCRAAPLSVAPAGSRRPHSQPSVAPPGVPQRHEPGRRDPSRHNP